MNQFDTIKDAIEDIKLGKMVIVLDDEDRENEGDFIAAAEKVTPEMINFMATVGRGLICTPLTNETAKRLKLPLMVDQNNSCHETAFTVSLDSKNSGTGISAFDRAVTISEMMDEKIPSETFLRPGHIFPLIARDGGVIERPGHTEAAVDLARLAGLKPMGIICEVMSVDGTMAKRDELVEIANKFDLKIITIDSLIEYRRKLEVTTEVEVINLPTEHGDFKLHLFEDNHMALVKGDLGAELSSLIRLHSECLTGDIFSSKRCDCGDQLDLSLKKINEKGSGALLYLRQEGRGIGLENKIKAYRLQENGLDTIDANKKLGFKADLRDYKVAADMLKSLGVLSVDLLTNNPSKLEGLKSYGIKVNSRLALKTESNKHNVDYLKTKKNQMGHLLDHF